MSLLHGTSILVSTSELMVCIADNMVIALLVVLHNMAINTDIVTFSLHAMVL